MSQKIYHQIGIASLIILSSATLVAQTVKKQAEFSTKNKKVSVYITAENTTDRISKTETLDFTPHGQPLETEVCVFVDPAKTFQTFLGIGGALTDAVAETYYKLSKGKQKELITAYFDPKNGIGYTLGRTNIQSCDFSSSSYSYVSDTDPNFKTFSIEHDRKYRIPFIKEAMATASGKLTLFVTPWSPPAWMKTNNDVLHGGKLKPEFDQAWANFYVKFIKTYEKEGIPIWGLSVQNEPMATQTWESCVYSAEEERDFVKNFLGPTLHKNGLATKKLIFWDHNRDLIYQRVSTMLEDPEAAKYIWGIVFHWYETWSGSGMLYDNVNKVAEAFPNKNLIFTEGCQEKFDFAHLNDWTLGEKYGTSMIHDFNAGTVGWTDWNILLDEHGGPNHAGNFCFAPVHANTATDELIYTNAYYYIGQFSKFIHPGAKRIISSANRDKLMTTAFINKNGNLSIIVMNASDDKIPFTLIIKGNAAKTISLPHSIETLVVM